MYEEKDNDLDGKVEELIAARTAARKAKDFVFPMIGKHVNLVCF